ncbi:unnamed protein product [Pleuronectes platessa]|uniref:SPARC/Testican calcium-binding domain-containing protein n=1 Tax=Pleuronectes platessa TaxID=8262 RepID=A0A9N7YCJ4_PLEPL|nr:unnamed protein product [Pleuronectes platessa]
MRGGREQQENHRSNKQSKWVNKLHFDPLGWMNFDLLLDQAEMSTVDLDKYELCMKPLFQLISFKYCKLSYNEWCYCFQQPGGEGGRRVSQSLMESDRDNEAVVED